MKEQINLDVINNTHTNNVRVLNTVPTLDEAKSYINSIDFSTIINKVIETKKWKRNHVLKICELYKNYLYLQKKYQEYSLVPSYEIDEFWHIHILDTQKYFYDCNKIFGSYFHHCPNSEHDTENNKTNLAFEKTQQLHYIEFGEHINVIRRNFLVSWALNWASTPNNERGN